MNYLVRVAGLYSPYELRKLKLNGVALQYTICKGVRYLIMYVQCYKYSIFLESQLQMLMVSKYS